MRPYSHCWWMQLAAKTSARQSWAPGTPGTCFGGPRRSSARCPPWGPAGPLWCTPTAGTRSSRIAWGEELFWHLLEKQPTKHVYLPPLSQPATVYLTFCHYLPHILPHLSQPATICRTFCHYLPHILPHLIQPALSAANSATICSTFCLHLPHLSQPATIYLTFCHYLPRLSQPATIFRIFCHYLPHILPLSAAH